MRTSQKAASGNVATINFENVQYKRGEIEYNNGVIIILQPGFYSFTASLRCLEKNVDIGVDIRVNGHRMTLGKRYDS